jgi:hypothetical protein
METTPTPLTPLTPAPAPMKRPVGRPRKVRPPEEEKRPRQYSDSDWFMHSIPDNDEVEFERLFAEEQIRYSSESFNPEVLVWEDNHVLDIVIIYHREFTPASVLKYCKAIRGPYTHDGKLTPGGEIRARALLCRERLLAGVITDAERKPDLEKLREYFNPIWLELLDRA